MSDEALVSLIDRALEQTRLTGLGYAVLPLPWMEEWYLLAGRGLNRFRWMETCRTWHGGDLFIDDDGNVMLCLLGPGHDGPCGFVRVRGQVADR